MEGGFDGPRIHRFGDINDAFPHLQSLAESRPRIIVIDSFLDAPQVLETPPHWSAECGTPFDSKLLELCSSIGNVLSFHDLQGGRLIQDILPIIEDANCQVGSGAIKLELHTEDPSIEGRADYLGFLCVSNIDRIPTIVSMPDFSALSARARTRLKEPVFPIRSDRGISFRSRMVSPLVATSNGGFRMIYDPVYLIREDVEPRDLLAFDELMELVEGSVEDLTLKEGDVAFIDNYQVAHGRPRYSPRYDGTDRWLKRVQISLRPL